MLAHLRNMRQISCGRGSGKFRSSGDSSPIPDRLQGVYAARPSNERRLMVSAAVSVYATYATDGQCLRDPRPLGSPASPPSRRPRWFEKSNLRPYSLSFSETSVLYSPQKPTTRWTPTMPKHYPLAQRARSIVPSRSLRQQSPPCPTSNRHPVLHPPRLAQTAASG